MAQAGGRVVSVTLPEGMSPSDFATKVTHILDKELEYPNVKIISTHKPLVLWKYLKKRKITNCVVYVSKKEDVTKIPYPHEVTPDIRYYLNEGCDVSLIYENDLDRMMRYERVDSTNV